MSNLGIQKYAAVMTLLQQTRIELIRMGTSNSVIGTNAGNQDNMLGHLLGEAEDAVKDKFLKIIEE